MSTDGLGPPSHDHAGRLGRLQAALAGHGVTALVVSNLFNVRYLCGFTGSNGSLVVTAEAAALVTDGRYRTQAAEQLEPLGDLVDLRVDNSDLDTHVVAATHGAARVGLEAATVTWATQRRYAERFGPAELVALVDVVEPLRACKDEGEIDRIERAAHIADAALTQTIGRLAGRPTERDVAHALEAAMRRMGAEGPSFDTIVASGPNAALPHARPSSRRIERGDLVVLDFGAMVDGYRSDMTRTVCVGRADAEQRRLFEVVATAQAAGRAAVRAGVGAAAIDAAARSVIADAGWADAFPHGTGHGIGLQVHESPILNRSATATVGAGYVITVEPGVYLPGIGGVRVEDTVVVHEGGCRSLTQFPKQLEW